MASPASLSELSSRPKRTSQPQVDLQQDRPASNKDGSKSPREGDLTQSLQHLTISTTSSPARQPRAPRPSPLKPTSSYDYPSESSPRRPSSAMRSPLSNSSSVRSPSRAGTPALLRKASTNSLRSVNGVTPLRRASSASILSPTPSRSARSPLRSMSPEFPEKPILTPQAVANAHFKAELDALHGPDWNRPAETVVILQDACYGHRFSRPKTSKAQLSTIVERPERVKACVLGVSAAYVRLGERHQDGDFPIAPEANPAQLPTIPFRIQKSDRRLPLTSQTVTNVHGTKWMEELKIMCETAESKLAVNGKELQRPDIDRGANTGAPQKLHEGDLYLCAETLEALEGALGGVCDAVDAVFRPQGPQRAFVAIRPPGHHCSGSYPSGFCWINNVHVGIMHAILSHGLTHAAIIDFDLHHGDGSQSIAWLHNARSAGLGKNAAWWKKTSIGYFSLHDINSYPCEMGDEDKVRNASICIDNAHGQSIWNVHLQPWKTEADFWALYESKYSILLDKTREYLRVQTEKLRAQGMNSRAAIFLSAGFDASEWESPGMQRHNVNVPTEFYARLTRDVVKIAAEEGTSVEGRVISVLEGGYSDRALCSGVLSHICGLAGDGPRAKQEVAPSGLGYEMGQKLGTVEAVKGNPPKEDRARQYDPSWWSVPELEALEAAISAPSVEIRKPRNFTPPTYSSPTQASAARAAVPPKNTRRSVSGFGVPNSHGHNYRAPTPPPPDVAWTTAALELSRLLIPSGRQTNSCTHEELGAEATRARRERQFALAQGAEDADPQTMPVDVPPPVIVERAPTRMSLRERKTRPTYLEDEDDDRKSRRKTVAGPAVLATEKKRPPPSRRLSTASTTVSTAVSETVDLAPPLPTAPIRAGSRLEHVRSDSVASVRTDASGINVRKTRAPAKKEPVPRAPRVSKKHVGAPAVAAPELPKSGGEGGDEVDKLAKDMKKIKITVVSKAVRDARERERNAQAKLAATDTISVTVPTEPNENKPLLSVQPPENQTVPTTPSDTESTFISSPPASAAENYPLPALSSPGHYQPSESPASPLYPASETFSNSAMSSVTPTFSSPVRGVSPHRTTSTPTPMDMFVHYHPDGPTPESNVQQQQQPLQWLPPNVATPVSAMAPMKRGDLPVFSSTGAIPFSPGPPQTPVSSPPPPVAGRVGTPAVKNSPVRNLIKKMENR
ncbi:histone deacetylase [Podospora pseudocomata]|uniref:Histone deacetylase n=1 Tax=Podospora pseudocomata TaxID=2093779 RepID=A0ABR0GZ72_9PEZI|nr:histone deacetylase [Podospora pseudocomata]